MRHLQRGIVYEVESNYQPNTIFMKLHYKEDDDVRYYQPEQRERREAGAFKVFLLLIAFVLLLTQIWIWSLPV